jgi:hypothetical protein
MPAKAPPRRGLQAFNGLSPSPQLQSDDPCKCQPRPTPTPIHAMCFELERHDIPQHRLTIPVLRSPRGVTPATLTRGFWPLALDTSYSSVTAAQRSARTELHSRRRLARHAETGQSVSRVERLGTRRNPEGLHHFKIQELLAPGLRSSCELSRMGKHVLARSDTRSSQLATLNDRKPASQRHETIRTPSYRLPEGCHLAGDAKAFGPVTLDAAVTPRPRHGSPRKRFSIPLVSRCVLASDCQTLFVAPRQDERKAAGIPKDTAVQPVPGFWPTPVRTAAAPHSRHSFPR